MLSSCKFIFLQGLSSCDFVFFWLVSSSKVIFLRGWMLLLRCCIIVRSSSCEVVFLWDSLIVRLSLMNISFNVFFQQGCLPVRKSSCEEVFLRGCLPFPLFSFKALFLCVCLYVSSTYCEVFSIWGRLHIRLSSCEVVLHLEPASHSGISKLQM